MLHCYNLSGGYGRSVSLLRRSASSDGELQSNAWITCVLQRAFRKRKCGAAGEKRAVTRQVDPFVRCVTAICSDRGCCALLRLPIPPRPLLDRKPRRGSVATRFVEHRDAIPDTRQRYQSAEQMLNRLHQGIRSRDSVAETHTSGLHLQCRFVPVSGREHHRS